MEFVIDRPYVTCHNTTDDIVLDQVINFYEDADFAYVRAAFHCDKITRGWRGNVIFWLKGIDAITEEHVDKMARKWEDLILLHVEPEEISRSTNWIYKFSKSHL